MPETIPTKGSLESLREDAMPPFNAETGGVGIGSAFQMILALVVVVLLVKFLVPKFLGKMFKKSSHSELGPEFEVIQTTTVGSQQLHLVKVRNRTLLLGSSQSGVNLISDLTEEQTVYNLPIPEPKEELTTVDNFDDMLERLKRLSG